MLCFLLLLEIDLRQIQFCFLDTDCVVVGKSQGISQHSAWKITCESTATRKATVKPFTHTVMTYDFWTHGSGQTVQTQIRLLLEEQSDQGLHCLLFHLHLFDEIPKGLASFLEF